MRVQALDSTAHAGMRAGARVCTVQSWVLLRLIVTPTSLHRSGMTCMSMGFFDCEVSGVEDTQRMADCTVRLAAVR